MNSKMILSVLLFIFATGDCQAIQIMPPAPANPSLLSTFFPWLRPRTIPGLPAPVNNALANMFPWANPSQLQNIPGMQIPLQGLQTLQNIFRPVQQPAFFLPPSQNPTVQPSTVTPTQTTPSVALLTQATQAPALSLSTEFPTQFSNFIIPSPSPGVPNLPGSNLIAGLVSESEKNQEVPLDEVEFL